jgi:hypothetical protein
MGTIFVSYSSKDIDFVESLATKLRDSGYSIWYDKWNIMGQSSFFWDEIQEGIDKCTHFLFILSPHSLNPYGGALKELYYATGLNPPPQVILTVALPETIDYQKLPMIISANRYQIYDFTKALYSDIFIKLCVALEPALQQPSLIRHTSIIKPFIEADFEEFADLIKRSGRADPQARRAFCLVMGIDPGDIIFITNTTDRDFSILLTAYLYGTGNFLALIKICQEIERYIFGAYKEQLNSLLIKLKASH